MWSGLSLTLSSSHFAVVIILVAVFIAFHMKDATVLPCDVPGKVVWVVFLQDDCSSGVLRKQSQHRWCSMPPHMAGSQPGKLTIVLHPFLSCSSLYLTCLSMSVNLCFFLSFTPAAPVSFGLPCCVSVCICLSVSLFYVCVVCSDAAHQSCRLSTTTLKGLLQFITTWVSVTLSTISVCYDNIIPPKVIVEIVKHDDITTTLSTGKKQCKVSAPKMLTWTGNGLQPKRQQSVLCPTKYIYIPHIGFSS